MDMNSFFAINFAPIVGIIFLLIFLGFNARLEKRLKHLFFLLLALETAELLVYNIELLFAAKESFSLWRTLLSAMGYTLRPILSFLVLRLALRRRMSKTESIIMMLPIVVNTIIAFSAFWTDIAYSYTPMNEFVRGPLGYSSHVCVSLYLAVIIAVTFAQLSKKNSLESLIIFATSLLIIGSMAIEAIWLIRSIGRTAMVLSTLFYYMFFQTQEYQASLDAEERIHEHLQQQARTDQTTGLLNKATFLLTLNQAFSSRKDAYSTLIFFDLDHFKKLNDTLGHQTGDEALRDVGDVLRRVFNKDAILARFGGDEFCVLLEGVTYEQLCQKLEELRCALRRTYINGKKKVDVTASIGAAVIEPGKSGDPSRMLELADAASYDVKNGSRDGFKVVNI